MVIFYDGLDAPNIIYRLAGSVGSRDLKGILKAKEFIKELEKVKEAGLYIGRYRRRRNIVEMKYEYDVVEYYVFGDGVGEYEIVFKGSDNWHISKEIVRLFGR